MITAQETRTIRLEAMTRVEGECGLRLEVRNGRLEEVNLSIYEPPRFFEAFLRGRSLHEVPDITARICGICPVAYQLTSVQAIESALRITPPPEIRALRRLLYWAEWIQSHALHIYFLQFPDFFGVSSGIALAAKHPDLVRRGLELKKIGNELMRLIGGRSVHPVAVCIGGFWKVPRWSILQEFRPRMELALRISIETVRLVAEIKLPDFVGDYEFVALSQPGEYAIDSGRITSSAGLDIAVDGFEQAFLEEHVAHSTALHSVRAERGSSYLVGPLSRMNLSQNCLSPTARQVVNESGIQWPCFNPYAGLVARAVELVQACEQSLQIIDSYIEPEPPHVEYTIRPGEGCSATEAPRGILYHRYRINDLGIVQGARIVSPTGQNCRRIEDDLRRLVRQLLDRTDEEIVDACEKHVRNYDPCISCSTHALRLQLLRH